MPRTRKNRSHRSHRQGPPLRAIFIRRALRELPLPAKAIAIAVAEASDTDLSGTPYASERYLATAVGKSRAWVRRWLGRLVAAGWIHRERQSRRLPAVLFCDAGAPEWAHVEHPSGHSLGVPKPRSTRRDASVRTWCEPHPAPVPIPPAEPFRVRPGETPPAPPAEAPSRKRRLSREAVEVREGTESRDGRRALLGVVGVDLCHCGERGCLCFEEGCPWECSAVSVAHPKSLQATLKERKQGRVLGT